MRESLSTLCYSPQARDDRSTYRNASLPQKSLRLNQVRRYVRLISIDEHKVEGRIGLERLETLSGWAYYDFDFICYPRTIKVFRRNLN